MDQKIIYLVRHGKIQLEDEKRRYIGQLDLPLSQAGLKQAEALGKKLAQVKIEQIYCSDLARSVATAKEIARFQGLTPLVRSDLREIKLGAWEGLTFAEIAQSYPQEFEERGRNIGDFCSPGGESFADCSKRVVAAFQEIVSSTSENILIVGHAGVNRLLLCHILGMQLTNLFRLAQDYACLNIIVCGSCGYRIKLLNSSMGEDVEDAKMSKM